MGEVVRGPWQGPHKEQRSCPGLSEEIRFISVETRQDLQHQRASFDTKCDVRPVHCRRALNALESLHERLEKLSQSLSRNTSLAIMLSPSRYPVLIDLCLMQRSTVRLMEQLDSYRVACLKSSPNLYPKRREIIALFDKVLRELESIPGLITSLERETEAQEYRLDTALQPDPPTLLPIRSMQSDRATKQEGWYKT